jgi:hypothetical protein
MNLSKRKFVFLSKRNIGLIVGIGVLGAFLSTYPYPFASALAVITGILIADWMIPTDEKKSKPDNRSIEKRSAEEIITAKLNDGVIEKAIDEQFEKMVASIVKDLFGDYGDVSRQIKAKLKDTMNPYIEEYDFGQHTVKLEHFLNQLVTELTKEPDTLAKNLREMMGTEPVKEMTSSKLFEKYTAFLGENIETSDLEIDYDDEPTYRSLTAEMQCEDERGVSRNLEQKILTLTCEEDERAGLRVGIERWTDITGEWRIRSIERIDKGEPNVRRILRGKDDLALLATPVTHLRDLNEFEAFLMKLHYDRASIILDETDIHDDEVEVEAKPEAYLA